MPEYLIEFYALGAYVKVSAIDPESGVEATIVGDAAMPKEYLTNLAVKKLEYKMKNS